MKNIALLAICASCLVFLSVLPASALLAPERLVYNISWTGFHAATAVHEVTAQGDDLRIVSTTRSSKWLNGMFPVDDRAESVITRNGGVDGFGVPKYYHEKINEGKRHVVKEAHFDPQDLTVETKDLVQKTEKTEQISPKTFDTLSSVYYIRSLDLVPGKSVFMDIYDCKRLWRTEVKVLGKEEVKTPVGKFKTIMVKPILKAEGASSRAGDVTIWVTDDQRKIPVKMTTKVKVGKISAMLVGGSYWPEAD